MCACVWINTKSCMCEIHRHLYSCCFACHQLKLMVGPSLLSIPSLMTVLLRWDRNTFKNVWMFRVGVFISYVHSFPCPLTTFHTISAYRCQDPSDIPIVDVSIVSHYWRLMNKTEKNCSKGKERRKERRTQETRE